MKVSHIENHVDEQSSHMQFIARAVSNLMSVGVPSISSHQIQSRRTALNEIWNKLSVNNNAITILLESKPDHKQQSAKAHVAYSDQASKTFLNVSKASSSAFKVFLSKFSICSFNHYAGKCPDYANQTVQRQLEIIKNKNSYFNRLGNM